MWSGLSHSIRSCSLAETPSHCHWRDIWPPKPFVSVGKQFDLSFIIPPVLRLWDIEHSWNRTCMLFPRKNTHASRPQHCPSGPGGHNKTTQRILNSL